MKQTIIPNKKGREGCWSCSLCDITNCQSHGISCACFPKEVKCNTTQPSVKGTTPGFATILYKRQGVIKFVDEKLKHLTLYVRKNSTTLDMRYKVCKDWVKGIYK